MQVLHRFIVDHYDLDELKDLYLYLDVNYDAPPGEGTAAKARELILYLGRLRKLEPLLDALRQDRPEAFETAGLGKITVEALHEALPDFEATDAPARRNVRTDGGAYVEGGVDTGGGDFVDRDKHVHGDEVHGDKIDIRGAQIGVLGDHAHIEGGIHFHAEDLRSKELAYLDTLMKRYTYWEQHYTPLAGIKEVRAAVKDGPRLDLPMPFTPPGFEKLVEHGCGARCKMERVPVDDIREAINEHRRIMLLGDPGSGKTTTLWRLAYEYAQAAREDEDAPLPVFVPLGGYTDPGSFDAYLACHLGPLGKHLEAYCAAGRLTLLLDGLNEMPRKDYAGRVRRIRGFLNQHPDGTAVVTCRALDYVEKLERLQKVEISPLDEVRIHAFLCNYLGETVGEQCFWAMAGDEVCELWEEWQGAGGSWAEFWTAEEIPDRVNWILWWSRNKWHHLRQDLPPLLALSRNPYLLLLTAQVYVAGGGKLPANRMRLFAAFVDTLLEREGARHPDDWIGAEQVQRGLSALAYAMQAEHRQGTTIKREWVLKRTRRIMPDCDVGRLLYLATSATLLDADEVSVRFHHQLLQEYFAVRELGRRVVAGENLARYWSAERWWEPSGWEETVILLAGMEEYASTLLERLTAVNPVLAGRCLLESGAQAEDATRRAVFKALLNVIADDKEPPIAHIQAGDTLARLGDLRPGVGGDPETGLPDFAWCEVPAGPFLMGSSDDDKMARDDEKPQHKFTLSAFKISKYPVTNSQYRPFVEAGGYGKRRYWTTEGWKRKEGGRWTAPMDYGAPFYLDNHPVVGVSWYEAMAYCRWLTEVWREADRIGSEKAVRLPTEAEWEKAARGTDGREYPWGDEADPARANYGDTGINDTSAVGCFPNGASPYGCLDMAGNIWEWMSSLHRDYPYDSSDGREDPEAGSDRVLRGGAFDSDQWGVRCAYRDRLDPFYGDVDGGFRVVVAPGSIPGAMASGAFGL